MTAIERLSSIPSLDAGIEMKSKMLSSLERRTSDADMPDKVKALRKEINDDIDRLIDRKQEVMNLIDSADLTPIETKILYLRYLCMMKWPNIAKEIHYSEASVHRLHQSALSKLDK